jgi:hypothetical protein
VSIKNAGATDVAIVLSVINLNSLVVLRALASNVPPGRGGALTSEG